MAQSANAEWTARLHDVLFKGKRRFPRGKETLEIINLSSAIDMTRPVITYPSRKMGYRFLFAEAHWILSGDNRLETIAPYAKHISNFSDDGFRFQGAYGPKVTEQLRYVVDTLLRDIESRQAIISIWRENPRESKDIPCTISLQFIVRDGKINCIANMRSSDLWLGWVYDVFNFTMISSWIALRLRQLGLTLELGTLYLNAGSQHIYSVNEVAANESYRDLNSWDYKSLSLSDFDSPAHLMNHLIGLRDRDWPMNGFMSELEHHVP